MGSYCLVTIVPKNSKFITSHGNLLKDILILIFYHLISKLLPTLFKRDLDYHDANHDEDSPSHHDQHDHDDEERRPNVNSVSFVPVPAYFFAESVKKQLPVMSYRRFLEKNGGDQVHDEDEDDDHEGCVCIVCLTRIEASHEVRVPFNCCHVFHRECLDVWVDQGQGTCPLCRSRLLPFPKSSSSS